MIRKKNYIQGLLSNIFILGILYFASCKSKVAFKIEFINSAMDSATNTTKISFKDLVNNYKSLQGQYVEIEGIVYWEFENVAICLDRKRDSKCFWLAIKSDLKINDSLLQKVSGQKFILKGAIDTSGKGHFSSYLATIRNVYFLKQK
jgi:hypothetical protein